MDILNQALPPDISDNDSYEGALKYLDKLFQHFPAYDVFDLTDIIIHSNLSLSDKELASNLCDKIRELGLSKFNYFEIPRGMNLMLNLSDIGRTVQSHGGHFLYMNSILENQQKLNEQQKRKDEIDKYDLLTKKWIYKTRLLPYFFSVVALIISILAFLKGCNN